MSAHDDVKICRCCGTNLTALSNFHAFLVVADKLQIQDPEDHRMLKLHQVMEFDRYINGWGGKPAMGFRWPAGQPCVRRHDGEA